MRLGIRNFNPKLRNAPQRLDTLRTPEGAAIPPNTLAELHHDMARLSLVKQQIKDIEATRIENLRRAPGDQRQAMVRLLTRVVGVGIETADMLVHEIFSRNLRDRKRASCCTQPSLPHFRQPPALATAVDHEFEVAEPAAGPGLDAEDEIGLLPPWSLAAEANDCFMVWIPSRIQPNTRS